MGGYVREYKAGFVMTENTAEELAAALLNAINAKVDGTLANMGPNGQIMVEQSFNWAHIVHQLTAEYAKALDLAQIVA